MGDPTKAPLPPRTVREMVERINGALGIEAAITVRGDELKCHVIDNEDGGRRKAYFNESDCAQLGEAFAVIGNALRGAS